MKSDQPNSTAQQPTTFDCFVCGRTMEQAIHEVSGGVLFFSQGNYGSRVLDIGFAGHDKYVVLAICDECLTANVGLTKVETRHRAPTQYFYEIPATIEDLP